MQNPRPRLVKAERDARDDSAPDGAGPEIGEFIGKELRSLYDDVVAQAVPDRFLDLLNQLEAAPISPVSDKKTPGKE